ncbi:MAG: hypothetical protein RL732_1421 [Bacteroidota bacterium]|jgi:phage shock protein PspC (stress-responsive transcriptional regulator)
MKKVININFQGRVVPIEESAYEILKQYSESLRRYFAREEGREEIINDIESRIAELFSERLKKGTTCITDFDVEEVIRSMGRPEDFEAAEAEASETIGGSTQGSQRSSATSSTSTPQGRGRLYRNADDKVIAGVASGLANYLGVDPVLLRIFFVVLFAPLFWVYILLWIIVPSQSLQTHITKRLYRSSEHKVIGGVCGGLAAYFNIEVWIPRLIFALPLLVSLISGSYHFFSGWDFWFVPRFISGSLGSTLALTYIILWIALPVAVTAAEKLEMRGEKIDLNTIRNTVKDDLESLKSKTKDWGAEVKQTAQEMGEKARQMGETAEVQARQFSTEVKPLIRRASSGIGHVIGVLFKAFFFFIAGIIALSLFAVLISLLLAGFVVYPLKEFMLEGTAQQVLALGFLFLFLGIPLIALMTWLIRRIMGVRSRKHYLGYTFAGLWIIGIICTGLFFNSLIANFRYRSTLEDKVQVTQPTNGKLYVKVEPDARKYSSRSLRWDWDNEDFFYGAGQDSLLLSSVQLNIEPSEDDLYHVTLVRGSKGSSASVAQGLVQKISYAVTSQDSVLFLQRGFGISSKEKFRNQQVILYVEVPVGKKIEISNTVENFHFVNMKVNRFRGVNVQWEDWNDSHDWETNTEYLMTPENGLVRTVDLDPEELKRGRYRIISGYYDDDREEDIDRKQRIKERIRRKIDSFQRSIDSLPGEIKRDAEKAAESTTAIFGLPTTAERESNSSEPSLLILDRLIGQ